MPCTDEFTLSSQITNRFSNKALSVVFGQNAACLMGPYTLESTAQLLMIWSTQGYNCSERVEKIIYYRYAGQTKGLIQGLNL